MQQFIVLTSTQLYLFFDGFKKVPEIYYSKMLPHSKKLSGKIFSAKASPHLD